MDRVKYMDINEYIQYIKNNEKSIAEAKKEEESIESKKRDIESQIKDLNNNSSRRDAWISDIEYKIKEKQKEMDKFTRQYIEEQMALGFSEKEVMQGYYTREESIETLNKDIEKNKDEQKDFLKEIEKYQYQANNLEEEIKRIAKTIEELEKDVANIIIEWNKFNMDKLLNNPADGTMPFNVSALENARKIEEDIVKRLPKSLEREVRKYI